MKGRRSRRSRTRWASRVALSTADFARGVSPGLKALIAGLLLGDGYLCPNSKASAVSCALVLGQRVDRLEWLEQVRSAFAAEGVDCLPIRRTSVRDHRSGRRQHAVTLSTRFYRELLAERRRWYPGGTKVVPTDLSLTPTTLAHWYWGDGHCSHAKSVGLATNAFPIPDVMRLVAEIKARWGRHARVSASGTGPVIMISRREAVRAFIDLVRPMAPSCFKYKVPEVPDDGGKTRSERYGRSAFVGRSLNAAQVRDLRLI